MIAGHLPVPFAGRSLTLAGLLVTVDALCARLDRWVRSR